LPHLFQIKQGGWMAEVMAYCIEVQGSNLGENFQLIAYGSLL